MIFGLGYFSGLCTIYTKRISRLFGVHAIIKTNTTKQTGYFSNPFKQEERTLLTSWAQYLNYSILISIAQQPASTSYLHYPASSFEPVCQQTTAERVFPDMS